MTEPTTGEEVTKPTQVTRRELDKMSAAEINEARRAGRLHDLLTGTTTTTKEN